MLHATRFRTILCWLCTLLTLLLFAAFVFSTQRALSWDSPGARSSASLLLGAVHWSWRGEGWRLEEEKYPPQPGWSVAHYAVSPPPLSSLIWWPERGRSASWEWVATPLWIPLVLSGTTGVWLWYRDRMIVKASWRRWRIRVTPDSPVRVTFGLVAICCLINGVMALLSLYCFDAVYRLFNFVSSGMHSGPRWPHGSVGAMVHDTITGGLALLFLASPLVAIFWAWLVVRGRNRFFRRYVTGRCTTCGCDLTGNVSGRCPECGKPIASAPTT